MQELETLRLYIRETLRNIKKQQKSEMLKEAAEERSLRKMVRKMLREKQDTVQYNSTGINALEKLLSSIIPIIETGYKDLKTDPAQRKSFKAHILRGTQNLLSTASIYFAADKKQSGAGAPPTPLQPETAGIEAELKEQGDEATPPEATPADSKIIDIDKDKKVEKPNPLNAFQTVAGEDLTGRNFALETFKKVQKQILETYSLLSNEQDREMFYDFLITNLLHYFDKFETELEATPAEPTTPEYEAEKNKINASLQGAAPETGAEATPAAPEAAPAAELPPEAPPAA